MVGGVANCCLLAVSWAIGQRQFWSGRDSGSLRKAWTRSCCPRSSSSAFAESVVGMHRARTGPPASIERRGSADAPQSGRLGKEEAARPKNDRLWNTAGVSRLVE